MEELSTLDLIRMMDQIRDEKESLEAQLKEVNGRYDELRLRVIPQRFEQEGIESLTVEGVGRCNLTADAYVSIPAERKPDAYQFFSDIGKEDIITKTINASTLKAVVKEMVRQGVEFPEDVIKFSPYTRASITRR